ncbi:hypothetical protein [Streptomyces sp. SM11]|nr:hypothetical protein [Streptomyces sp. SM11]
MSMHNRVHTSVRAILDDTMLPRPNTAPQSMLDHTQFSTYA